MCGGPAAGPLGGGNGGALYAQDNTANAGTHIAGGAQAGWEFTAPTGTTITAVSYYRDLESKTDNLVAGIFQGNGAGIETCQGTFSNGFMCSLPNNQVPATFSGLATDALFFGVQCQLQGAEEYCLSGSSGDQLAAADMYSVAVTLSESASPSLSGETGALWAEGVVFGAAQLRFDASDPSGIAQVVLSDGSAVGARVQEPCSYTQAVPCPQLQPGVVNLNTTALPDGLTRLTLTVIDAAGNSTTATSPALTIDNNGPGAPSSLTASAVGGGSNTVNLRWSDPPSPPVAIAAADAELCQTSCGTPLALSPSGSGSLTAPGPGVYTIKLWLIDSAGKGGPQNATSTTVTVPGSSPTGKPGGKRTPGKLRVSARRRRGRLRVSVRVPAGEHGPVTVRLERRRGGRLRLFAKHMSRPRRGVAHTTFRLPRRLRRGAIVVLQASAHGAASARLCLVLRM
jgi:hypothetical protein